MVLRVAVVSLKVANLVFPFTLIIITNCSTVSNLKNIFYSLFVFICLAVIDKFKLSLDHPSVVMVTFTIFTFMVSFTIICCILLLLQLAHCHCDTLNKFVFCILFISAYPHTHDILITIKRYSSTAYMDYSVDRTYCTYIIVSIELIAYMQKGIIIEGKGTARSGVITLEKIKIK